MRVPLNTTVNADLLKKVREAYPGVPLSQLMDIFFNWVLERHKRDYQFLKIKTNLAAKLGVPRKKVDLIFLAYEDYPLEGLSALPNLQVEVLTQGCVEVRYCDRNIYFDALHRRVKKSLALTSAMRKKELEIRPEDKLSDVCRRFLDLHSSEDLSSDEQRFKNLMKELEES